jgi:predicted nucleotidyltransferase
MELVADAARIRLSNMNREQVIATLRAHEQELKGFGIVRLSLFGSVARGDASSLSDVDLMAEFDASKQFSLLDMVGLENRLSDILGVPVDLAPAKSLKDGIRERANREAVLAF